MGVAHPQTPKRPPMGNDAGCEVPAFLLSLMPRGVLDLWCPFRKRVPFADHRLGLPLHRPLEHLVSPRALQVVDDQDNLPVGKCVPKGRHSALETRQGRGFVDGPALADGPENRAVPVMPSVTVAVERRRGQGPIRLADVPVHLTFPIGAVAHGTVGLVDAPAFGQ